ncbi:hypothetical protein GCM10010421_10030 [Streptomyces glaucus]|uniref:PLL-like beta propeller domain-containing protein n=1 Tax=Streptomyces glaucus TaxID=284029 RepID=A0ABN3J9K8_9ACTN
MSVSRSAILRCTTTLMTAGLAVTMLSAVTAAPAQAASPIGGKITRSEILSRAQYWVDENVPYNQAGYYPDPQGTKYREDCSGYVSMAWHADQSYTTWTLPGISTDISNSQLLAGDALNYEDAHVVLFGGWQDKAAGTFTYFAENNPSVLTNKYTANINGSSLAGWPTSYYQAIRYDNVVDDPAQPTATGFNDGQGTLSIAHTRDGQLDAFITQSNGAIARNMETTPSGGWSGWASGFAGENTAKSVVTGVHPNGRVEVFALQTNGGVARRYQTSPYGAWSDWEAFAPANSATQIKVARHSDGRLSVFMLQTNGGIARKYETSVGGLLERLDVLRAGECRLLLHGRHTRRRQNGCLCGPDQRRRRPYRRDRGLPRVGRLDRLRRRRRRWHRAVGRFRQQHRRGQSEGWTAECLHCPVQRRCLPQLRDERQRFVERLEGLRLRRHRHDRGPAGRCHPRQRQQHLGGHARRRPSGRGRPPVQWRRRTQLRNQPWRLLQRLGGTGGLRSRRVGGSDVPLRRPVRHLRHADQWRPLAQLRNQPGRFLLRLERLRPGRRGEDVLTPRNRHPPPADNRGPQHIRSGPGAHLSRLSPGVTSCLKIHH